VGRIPNPPGKSHPELQQRQKTSELLEKDGIFSVLMLSMVLYLSMPLQCEQRKHILW